MNKNAKPNYKFPKGDQGLNEAKSQGQIRRARERNILAHIRSNLQDRNIIAKVFDVVETQVEMGITKDAIELIKIAKEPEEKTIKINGDVNSSVKINPKDVKKIIQQTNELAEEG